MDSNYKEMRLLFDVDAGNWRDGVYWKKFPTDIPLGRTGYRVHTYGAGQIIVSYIRCCLELQVVRYTSSQVRL